MNPRNVYKIQKFNPLNKGEYMGFAVGMSSRSACTEPVEFDLWFIPSAFVVGSNLDVFYAPASIKNR